MLKAPVASLTIVAAIALSCWGQEQNGATNGAETTDVDIRAAVLQAREAALEARQAARAAQLALERSKAFSTVDVEEDTPQTRRWRRAMRTAEHRRARLESQRWRRASAARPTIYVDPLGFGRPPSPSYVYSSITRSYSPYAPSVVVPAYRSRSHYSWYYE